MYCPCVSEYLCLCTSVSVLVGLPQTNFPLQWTDVNGDIYDRSKQWEYKTVKWTFINGAPISLLQCSERGNGKKGRIRKWMEVLFVSSGHDIALELMHSCQYTACTKTEQQHPIRHGLVLHKTHPFIPKELWAANGWWGDVLCVPVE